MEKKKGEWAANLNHKRRMMKSRKRMDEKGAGLFTDGSTGPRL